MKTVKTSIILSLFIFTGLIYTIKASAFGMNCGTSDLFCFAPVAVSNGTGAEMCLVSYNNNNQLPIESLPSKIAPPPSGHANTLSAGETTAYYSGSGSNQVVYSIILGGNSGNPCQGGQTLTTCTFNLNAYNANITATSACTNSSYNASVSVSDGSIVLAIN